MPIDGIDPATTALVSIDLQGGIMAMDTRPHAPAEVLERTIQLARAFRAAGSLVVRVCIGFSPDAGEMLGTLTDVPAFRQPGDPLPAEFVAPAPGIADPGDVVVTKHNWGAFYGTDLDLQLRRRGIRTVVVTGVATNQGVESTVRAGHEHGYNMVVVEDAVSGSTQAMHDFAVQHIFPRIARVTDTDEVLAAFATPV